jgi:antitoxin (DNA-binding transcriptional repressor) of toxin-antitoxin stability system
MKDPFKRLLRNICLSAEHGAKGASFRHPSRRKGDSDKNMAKVLAGEALTVIPREGETYMPRLVTVTAKDLGFNISLFFEMLSRGEEILITYKGKAWAKLISCVESSDEKKSDIVFGMWADKNGSVDEVVRNMRRGRNFDI